MWDVRPGRSVQESGSTIAAGTEKMAPRTKKAAKAKEVTRYVHEDALELATPETGHTALLAEEQAVTLAMDNGWADAVKVGRLPGSESPVIIDMDPAYDPVLFWAGKPRVGSSIGVTSSTRRCAGITPRATGGQRPQVGQRSKPLTFSGCRPREPSGQGTSLCLPSASERQ